MYRPSPSDIGLPSKFQDWRLGQWEAVDACVGDGPRFRGLAMPCGTGKSVCYTASSLIDQGRVVVLTSTKVLEKQLMDDFGAIGLVNIHGRNNYPCTAFEGQDCEVGAHLGCEETRIKVREEGGEPEPGNCPYTLAKLRALESRMVVTNYSYWMAVRKWGKGLGKADCLVLDEAHSAAEEVVRAMAVEIWDRDMEEPVEMRRPDYPDLVDDWQRWAFHNLEPVQRVVRALRAKVQGQGEHPSRMLVNRMRHALAVERKLETLAGMQGVWEVESRTSGRGSRYWVLEPLWARDYAADVLFSGVGKVLLFSATLCDKTLDLLGVGRDADLGQDGGRSFVEYPAIFPHWKSPFYYLPVARYGRKATEDDFAAIVRVADSIIEDRLDRKGIVHSVSYEHARRIQRTSRYGYLMVVPESGRDTEEAIARFRAAEAPCVLMSPAVTTGIDFPYDAAEFQIFPKVPFVPIVGRIMEHRTGKMFQEKKRGRWKAKAVEAGADPDYADYLTAQEIVQACGRPMRAADDHVENFMLDANFGWAYKSMRRFMPKWFVRMVEQVERVPKAPRAIGIGRTA